MYSRIQARLVFMVAISMAAQVAAQTFDAYSYVKAAWMTTRFYGAQRSGASNNWLLLNHPNTNYHSSFVKDVYNGQDVSGGWFDCGDHVSFGQTQFYTAYVLAKAYEQFPLGFRDLYNGVDYSDYVAAGAFSMDKGTPNGIPDLLDELNHEASYLVKVTPNASTFVFQKGQGTYDHSLWATAGRQSGWLITKGGELDGVRPIFANPADAAMPSFAAASLAVLAKLNASDATKAASYRAHAEFAYQYALAHPGAVGSFPVGGACDSGNPTACYIANGNWRIPLLIASAEMFSLTQDSTYWHRADSLFTTNVLSSASDYFDYNNNAFLAYYVSATILGKPTATVAMASLVDNYANSVNAEGVTLMGNTTWGSMRYVGSAAFAMALYAKASGVNTYKPKMFKQVDFLMGNNPSGRSFIVGFCQGCRAQSNHPHHRNVYLTLSDANPTNADKQLMTISTNAKQLGALVGGGTTRLSTDYSDQILNYASTEVCIDYNSGLVGALGAIVAEKSPANTAVPAPLAPSLHSNVSTTFSVANQGSGYLFSSSSPKPFTVEILDLQGASVSRLRSDGQAVAWKSPASGMYQARLSSQDGQASQTFRVASVQ